MKNEGNISCPTLSWKHVDKPETTHRLAVMQESLLKAGIRIVCTAKESETLAKSSSKWVKIHLIHNQVKMAWGQNPKKNLK